MIIRFWFGISLILILILFVGVWIVAGGQNIYWRDSYFKYQVYYRYITHQFYSECRRVFVDHPDVESNCSYLSGNKR